MNESFANYPKSIGELRADKTENGAAQSPRDALISMLRKIDSGQISPTTLIICWSSDGYCDFENSAPSLLHGLGTVMRCAYRMNVNADPSDG